MPARQRQATKHALLVPLDIDPDGRPITVAERVAAAVRLGATLRTAAARAGVAAPTLHAWLRNGNRHAAAIASGSRLESELTDGELAELVLVRDYEDASAACEMALLTQLDAVSQPRSARVVTVREDADGNVDRTERVEDLDPDATTIRWRLERGYPEHWGKRETVTLDVAPDVAERAAELVAQLRAGGANLRGG
jgi:transposase-like protein